MAGALALVTPSCKREIHHDVPNPAGLAASLCIPLTTAQSHVTLEQGEAAGQRLQGRDASAMAATARPREVSVLIPQGLRARQAPAKAGWTLRVDKARWPGPMTAMARPSPKTWCA